MLAALAAVLLLAAPTRADVPGALGGTVSGPGGPLDGVQVTVRPFGGGPIAGTTGTNSGGQYTLAPLDAGDYTVRFAAADYVPEYFDDATNIAAATRVTVAPFGNAQANATLAPDATVSGTVTDSSLNPAEGICVSASPAGSGVVPQPVTTDVDGHYTVAGIGAGTYTVQFDSCDSPNNLVTEWYDDQPTPATADTFTITTGQTLTGIDAALAMGGSISGTLLRANGQPADGAQINVRSMSGTLLESRPTNLDGSYTVDQLAAGNYKVEFLPPADSFDTSEFYDDQPDVASATPVAVTMGANTPGIDAQLAGDTVAPDVTIDGGPDGLTNDSTPTFAFSTEPDATVECSIDTGTASWNLCSDAAGHTPATALGDGSYTFRVRATDPSQNLGTPATRSFTLDATAPSLSITSGPSGPTGVTSPSFGFAAEAGSTVQCAVDPAGAGSPSYGTCTGSDTHDAGTLADGDYSFRVQATDTAGNVSTAQRDFTVDGSAPAVSITGGPNGPTNDTTPSFTFTAEAGATLECAVDAAGAASPSFGSCSSAAGHTPAALAEGDYTFAVRATDAANNQTTDTRSFTVDTTPPAVQVTGGPAGATTTRAPTFSFTAESGATLECSVDTGAASYGACSGAGTHTPSPLPDGAYTFRVRATDAAGNSAADTRSFVVVSPDPPPPPPPAPDTTAPSVTITGGPSGKTKDRTPTFSFASNESGASFKCKVDGGSFSPCGSPTTLKKLKSGSHTFAATATDAAGNVSAPATRSFKVKKKRRN